MKTLSKSKQTKIKATLKKYGHRPDLVDKLKLGDTRQVAEAMAEIHGMTVAQIKAALEATS